MRILIGAGLTVAALVLGTASISAQVRKDGGAGAEKGQSERAANPKHNEPESLSHNADKPKAQSGTDQSGTKSTQPQSGESKQPAKSEPAKK